MTGFDWRSLRDLKAVFHERRTVRFQEVDAAGFVFFARILDWFHDAWIACIEANGLRYVDVVRAGQWGAPLRHVDAEYLSPLRFGDVVDVGLVKVAFDESNHYVGYSVIHEGRVAAVGMTHHVLVGLQPRGRISPPKEFRDAFAAFALPDQNVP